MAGDGKADGLAGKDIHEILKSLDDYSPEEIHRYLGDPNSFAGESARWSFLRQYIDYLSSLKDTDALLAHLSLCETSPGMVQRCVSLIAEKSPLMSPAFAVEVMKVMDSETAQHSFGQSLMRHRLKLEEDLSKRLEMAQSYIESELPPGVVRWIVGMVADDIMATVPEEMEAWLLGLPADVALNADGNYLRMLAERDVKAATAYVQQLSDLGKRLRAQQAAGSFLGKYQAVDPRAAMEWVLALPDEIADGDFQESFVEDVYFAYGNIDPIAADRLLDQGLADPELRERIREGDLKTRRALGMLPK